MYAPQTETDLGFKIAHVIQTAASLSSWDSQVLSEMIPGIPGSLDLKFLANGPMVVSEIELQKAPTNMPQLPTATSS